MYSKKFIDDVRAATNIVEIVSEVIELTAFRGDRYKGLCPFHNESSPSFSVDKNLFYCFGCGEGGDTIRFVERAQDITFGAAVRLLADRYGIVDLDSNEPRRPARPIKRKISGIRQPEGYVAPSQSLAPFWDATKMEHVVAGARVEACWGELYHPDYDFLLTMGIVPSDLIMELWRDVGMPNL
jgi:hypothetical protein